MHKLLRKKIIERFERPVNTPKDCKLLSEIIFDQTKRTISSTTLRRFFGLLVGKSAISAYNLDTLSMYCGFNDYSGFCSVSGIRSLRDLPGYDVVREKMDQITDYTLTSITRKSLTKFGLTIPREDINRRLNAFLDSPYSVFPLIAPGGYGKSIALAHWVKSLNNKNDHCLFCPASIFYQLLSDKGIVDAGYRNMPVLSNDEIRLILKNVNEASAQPILYNVISWELREMIKIPINLHFFIRVFNKKLAFSNITRNALNQEYLKEVIFLSKYAEEKEDLIWKIVELIENKTDDFFIQKNELKAYYPVHLIRETKYYSAYNDLLTSGILLEKREENKYGIFITWLSFKHLNFYYYFIKRKKIANLSGFIRNYQTIAYQYKNYLDIGLPEFEVSIMVALAVIREFEVLKEMLEIAVKAYNFDNPKLDIFSSLSSNQNSLPVMFLKYAKYKLGKIKGNDLPALLEKTINNFVSIFEDFNYQIMLKWFLCDYYVNAGDIEKAKVHFQSALDISQFAKYDFYTAFLMINNPGKDPAMIKQAEEQIKRSGFNPELFIQCL